MSKKMCPKTFPHTKKGAELAARAKRAAVAAARQFTIPVLKENGAGTYIEYRAFDPVIGKLHRVTIKLNNIKSVTNRRKHARDTIKRLTEKLQKGWNPWINGTMDDMDLFEDALTRYERHLEKMLASGGFRKETYSGYKSNIKIMREYIAKKHPLHYVYQFNRSFCVDFLDYIFIDRNNGAQTRNNYLNFLRVFSGFLVDKGLLDSRPTDGIAPISKRLYAKERQCIPLDIIGKLAGYCREHDPHFLLACYLLYYCFIRPVEMTRLRVKYFNLNDGTVLIPAECSKNKKSQKVTVPKKVLLYAVDLGVMSAPLEDFIFSDKLKPGKAPIDPKIFRDHWEKARKHLKLKREWKFYSLKDTGITALCEANMTAIDIRDQARHSSLAITDLYTNHHRPANQEILNLDGAL